MNNREKLKAELFDKWNWDEFFTPDVKEGVWAWVDSKLDEEYLKGLEDAYGHIMSTMNEVMLEAGKQLKETD